MPQTPFDTQGKGMEGVFPAVSQKKSTNVAKILTMQKLKNQGKNVLILRDHKRNKPIAICTADPHKSPTILALSADRVSQFFGAGNSEKLLLADFLHAPCDLEELHAYLHQDNCSIHTPPLLIQMKNKMFIWAEKMCGKDAELLELLAETGTLELTKSELVQVVNSLIIVDHGEESVDVRVSPRDVQKVASLENCYYGELSFDEVFEGKDEDNYDDTLGDSGDYEPGYDFEQQDLMGHFSPFEKSIDLDLLMGKSSLRRK